MLGERSHRSNGRGRRRLRWGFAAVSSALTIAGGLILSESSGAGADTGSASNATQGSSFAQYLQVTPHEGSLAVGAVFGEALAGHTNTFSKAQSQGLDLGAVGVSMRGYNCNMPPNQYVYNAVPQPLIAESGSPGAAQGQTQSPSMSDYGATEYALANDNPYSESDTSFAGPLADPTNAFVANGLHTKSWSGEVNGVPEAGATSDISQLTIGGTVVLDGLDWSAVYPTDGSTPPSGSFTVGKVVIGGAALPSSANLSAVQSAINAVLTKVGLEVQMPQVTVSQGTQYVTPLEVQVVPNSTRDSVLDPAIVALQPNYYQIANGLENGFGSDKPPLSSLGAAESTPQGQQLAGYICESDTPITVADITVAAFDGGGYFNAALGGVNASSSALPSNNYSLSALGLGDLNVAGSSQFIPGTLGTDGTPGSPGSSGLGSSPSGGPSSPGTFSKSAAPASATRGAKGSVAGGPLLAAGLGGLGLMGLLAEADRRKMRVAQRVVQFEE